MSATLPPSAPVPRTASVINRIVASSLRQRFLVVLMTLVLIVAGTRSLNRLPVDAYPDLSPPLVEVITQWPGHAAEEVERLITVPTEREMNGLPRLVTSRSISLYGLSDVILTFQNGTDDYFARQQVFNRVGELTLPNGVTPTLAPLSAPSGLIYRYVLQSPDRSPMELKTFEDWTIEPQYRSVAGVADDSGFGGGTMQYQVLLDPARVASDGLSVQQVEDALTANNGNAGGGFYSQGGQFYYVRGMGRLRTLEDIGNVVVAVHDGTQVLVKEVGRVVIGIAPRLGEFGYQDQDDAVEGVILLRTGEKTQDVLEGVEAKTRELNSAILPKDVKILPFYDRSDLVDLTKEVVERNLLRGMLLVVAVLIFFLYDFRAGLIVAASIPLALLFAFICLDLQNASVNLLSIGAVDFGILVDGAVVMVENIFRQMAARRELAEDVFNHHHRTIDQYPEVHGADGEQVGRGVLQVEAHEREQQGQRDAGRDNQSRAKIVQEEYENHDDQQQAAQEVVLHDLRRQIHEVTAIVERQDLDVLRQDLRVQLVSLGFNPLQDVLSLFAGPEQDDALDGIVLFLIAELAETRGDTDDYAADVLYQHRSTVMHGYHYVADVLQSVYAPEPAHIKELAALRIETAAGIVVIGRQRALHLLHRQPDGCDFRWIQ